MITKIKLNSLINKYYLGENESVVWEIANNNLHINFSSINKEVIGSISYSDIGLEPNKIAIYDTKKLLNLLSITQGDLLIEVEKNKNIPTKLHISDESFNLTYALADPLLISKQKGTVNEPEWDATFELSGDDLDKIIKAKSALKDVNNMLISIGEDGVGDRMCLFTFGDEHGHNNKITYQIYGNIQPTDIKIPFNSDMLRNILYSNKDMEVGHMYLSYQGLIKLTFKNAESTCIYYLIRKEQNVI